MARRPAVSRATIVDGQATAEPLPVAVRGRVEVHTTIPAGTAGRVLRLADRRRRGLAGHPRRPPLTEDDRRRLGPGLRTARRRRQAGRHLRGPVHPHRVDLGAGPARRRPARARPAGPAPGDRRRPARGGRRGPRAAMAGRGRARDEGRAGPRRRAAGAGARRAPTADDRCRRLSGPEGQPPYAAAAGGSARSAAVRTSADRQTAGAAAADYGDWDGTGVPGRGIRAARSRTSSTRARRPAVRRAAVRPRTLRRGERRAYQQSRTQYRRTQYQQADQGSTRPVRPVRPRTTRPYARRRLRPYATTQRPLRRPATNRAAPRRESATSEPHDPLPHRGPPPRSPPSPDSPRSARRAAPARRPPRRAARLPVERSSLLCPAPSTSDLAETSYTSFTPAGKGGGARGHGRTRPVHRALADGHAGDDDKKTGGKKDRRGQGRRRRRQETGTADEAGPRTSRSPASPSRPTPPAPTPLPRRHRRAAGSRPAGRCSRPPTVAAGSGRGLLGHQLHRARHRASGSRAPARTTPAPDYVHLTNPDDTAAVADVELYGKDGALKSDGGGGHHGPAALQRPGPAVHAHRRERRANLTVHVSARSGPRGRRGQALDDKLGGDWLAASADPAGSLVLPGIPADATSVRLVAFAPGDDDADLKVRLAAPTGQITPGRRRDAAREGGHDGRRRPGGRHQGRGRLPGPHARRERRRRRSSPRCASYGARAPSRRSRSSRRPPRSDARDVRPTTAPRAPRCPWPRRTRTAKVKVTASAGSGGGEPVVEDVHGQGRHHPGRHPAGTDRPEGLLRADGRAGVGRPGPRGAHAGAARRTASRCSRCRRCRTTGGWCPYRRRSRICRYCRRADCRDETLTAERPAPTQ